MTKYDEMLKAYNYWTSLPVCTEKPTLKLVEDEEKVKRFGQTMSSKMLARQNAWHMYVAARDAYEKELKSKPDLAAPLNRR